MESIMKRVIMAESETAIAKEKVTLGQDEIKKKVLQIESMSMKLEEMERFALGTNCILKEMRQRVENLVEETFKQRQRSAENEQEFCRVKQDFESLKSYVSSLINMSETLMSSEKQFQTIERLLGKLLHASIFLLQKGSKRILRVIQTDAAAINPGISGEWLQGYASSAWDHLIVTGCIQGQESRGREIVLKAMGQAISKIVAIAEIIKRRIPRLHQDTSISSVSITDVWEPIEEGLLL
ncbi:hypothetical protein U1Q18_045669, partial [Sarracenia purpurea var. burkii]